MATITYDGLSVASTSKLVTFSDVPNILTIEEIQSGAYFNLDIVVHNSTLNPSTEGEYYITVMGDTITSTLSPLTATNKLFWICYNADNTASAKASTAASICRALRNCNNLASGYDIWQDSNVVHIKAKKFGFVASNVSDIAQTNFPNIGGSWFQYIYPSITESGSTSTDMYGAKIQADVYIDGEFKTNLEKTYYSDEVAFDVSPILASYSDFGKLTPYTISLSKINADGTYSIMGDDVSGSTINGYQANNSSPYLFMSSTPQVMSYIDGDSELTICGGMELSLLTSANSITYKVIGYDGDGNATFTHTNTAYTHNGVAEIKNGISQSELNSSNTIVFSAGSITQEYMVIKPTRAAEDVKRVAWRNEYGGVSFFDFTAKYQETFSIDSVVFKKNVFDFYSPYSYEEDKILTTKEKKTMKLTSHLLGKKAIWIFNSLARAKKVWTYADNGDIIYIIPKSLEVQEDGTFNDIYTATLTYNYSYEKE